MYNCNMNFQSMKLDLQINAPCPNRSMRILQTKKKKVNRAPHFSIAAAKGAQFTTNS